MHSLTTSLRCTQGVCDQDASAMTNTVHGQDVDAKLPNVFLNFEKSNSKTLVRCVSKAFIKPCIIWFPLFINFINIIPGSYHLKTSSNSEQNNFILLSYK